METLETPPLQISRKYPLEKTLNWEAEKSPICTPDGQQVNGFYLLSNSRTGQPITVHRSSYTPVANARLQEMAERLESFGGFKLEGFATYNGGRKIMAYLKQEAAQDIAGQRAANYLVIGNSHDGSTAFFSGHTNHIYRCKNMFTAAHMQNRIWHTANSAQEVRALENTYDLYFNKATGVYEMAEQMQETPTRTGDKGNFIKHVLQISNIDDLPTVTKNRIDILENSLALEADAVGQTAFGLFNGATHYTTHELKQKRPVFGNPFNTAYAINKRAFDFCAEMARERKKTAVPVLLPRIEVAAEACPY